MSAIGHKQPFEQTGICGERGGARHSGNRPNPARADLSSQVSMSILITRFSLCAQLIDAWCSAGD